ncbi:response regulator [Candidatus Chlorohelix sp.]|uniref:response regulator transcription factor n=1 Tax=Candidatus Chlorohelix sp. TaxID=3139201 RepID=UPI00306F4F12
MNIETAGRKILVIDDEPGIVDIVETNLLGEGFEVISAKDGKEGLDKIRSEFPDLVILDVMMPEMDGWQVLRELEKEPETAGIPVIMLTAKAADEDYIYGLEEGAVEYLTKPFFPQELINRIKITLMILNPRMRDERRRNLVAKRKKLMEH